MCFRSTSNMFWKTVSDFDNSFTQNLFCTFFLSRKGRNRIWPGCSMFIKSSSDSSVQLRGKMMLLVQLDDERLNLYIGVAYKLAVPLVVDT